MVNNGTNINKFRWVLILVFLFVNLIASFHLPALQSITPIITVLCLFIAVCSHGNERYGLKNIFIFFMITWIISHFFEALSIQTGFPFGHYYYDQLVGPRLFQVPLIIMLAYFGTGYASWIISHILLDQYNRKLAGKQLFLVPLIATFIMVMWDVCMDPLASTIGSLWVWKDGGPYFGVPLQNYFGWFFVVYIIFQLEALYLNKYDTKASKVNLYAKNYWLQPVALYSILGLSHLLDPFTHTEHLEIFGPIAMLTIFTMLFAGLLGVIKLYAD